MFTKIHLALVGIWDGRAWNRLTPEGMILKLTRRFGAIKVQNDMFDLFKKIVRLCRNMDNPPLVTPAPRIILSRTTLNVLSGRYVLISNPFLNPMPGLCGTTPAPGDKDPNPIILKCGKRAPAPIADWPTESLPSQRRKATQTSSPRPR